MDRIIVIPDGIRCLGNIVSPKSSSDFDVSNSKINASSGTVNGVSETIYSMEYLNGSYFIITCDRFISSDNTLFNVTALLKYNTGNVIYSQPVQCIVNEDTILNATTNTDGVALFSVPIVEGVDVYNLKVVHQGNNNVAGCSSHFKVIVGEITDFDFSISNELIQIDEDSLLIGKVTGVNSEGEVIGIPGQTVSFYEEYSPVLSISSEENIIMLGDTVNFESQILDSKDYNLVRQSGVPINFYSEKYPHAIQLVTDRNVLSAENSDCAYISAYYKDTNDCAMIDEMIDFEIRDNEESLIDSIQGVTDNTGRYSISYDAAGIGEVFVKCFDTEKNIVSDSLKITDCLIYNPEDILTQQVFNSSLGTTDFKVVFSINAQSRSACYSYLRVGSSWNNCIQIGQIYNNGTVAIRVIQNNQQIAVSDTYTVPLNEDITLEYSKQEDTHTLKIADKVLTLIDKTYSNLNLIRADVSNNKCSNLQVYYI